MPAAAIRAKKNYRHIIMEICQRYSKPGDDLPTALLTGAPKTVSSAEALRIADWLDEEADSEWGEDERHSQIAEEIRAAVECRVAGKRATHTQ